MPVTYPELHASLAASSLGGSFTDNDSFKVGPIQQVVSTKSRAASPGSASQAGGWGGGGGAGPICVRDFIAS